MNEPLDARIIELNNHNPIVHHFATLYIRGDLSMNQMLTECVVALAEVNKKQFDTIVKMEQENPVPHFHRNK